ncbi:uncharacterized protein ZNF470-DT [Homo sapiens]|uniref:uncharacterized protein ZNF470-DT n=1 Tax=Homo sapiens TaxID=9606 RepID=UPI000387BDFF|nr:uncharacterized protein ZNF470-DT [Homo sapiens]
MVFAPRRPVDMEPCPGLCPFQIGLTGNASAEAAPPGQLPRALGLCPHWALRSRYRGERGKPPPAGFPALGHLKCFTHSNTHRLPHAAGPCTQAQIRGHAPDSHTPGRHPRARSPLLSTAPHAHHVWALTATRPHAHAHARRPHRNQDTAPAAPQSSLGRCPAQTSLLLSNRRDVHSPGFGSFPEVGVSSAAIAPGKCSPERRRRSEIGRWLCQERLLSKPGGHCPVSPFGPLLVLLVGLGGLSARSLGRRSTGPFTEATHGAGVSGSHRQAPSVQMQLPGSGRRELASSSQERLSVVGRVAGVGCAGAVGQH